MHTFEILLVEDSQNDAHVFEAALKQASARARVYWVGTGKEALDFLRQQGRFEGVGTVRMVVLDLHLNGEDGLDILREVKSDPDLSRTPTVMLTSSVSQDEIDLAYSLGANAYFRKPVTLESYVELLRVMAQHWLDLAQLPTASRAARPPRTISAVREQAGNKDQGS